MGEQNFNLTPSDSFVKRSARAPTRHRAAVAKHGSSSLCHAFNFAAVASLDPNVTSQNCGVGSLPNKINVLQVSDPSNGALKRALSKIG